MKQKVIRRFLFVLIGLFFIAGAQASGGNGDEPTTKGSGDKITICEIVPWACIGSTKSGTGGNGNEPPSGRG